ncbi:hypothetical protein ALQ21_200188 [Pseudomonas savastanoi pv. glycinea]|nr:hypothetical protein ALQ21_200188 [Pseudomonas savastanoi pv. glycinea]
MPRLSGGFTKGQQPFDLMLAQTGVERGRDHRQQATDGLLHTTDMRVGYRVTVCFQSSCQFPLRYGLAGFLLIDSSGIFNAHGALDEHQVTAQVVFCQVTGEGNDFPTLAIPGAEQHADPVKALVPRFFVQLSQNRQPRIAAVADDELLLTRTTCDLGGLIQPPDPNGVLDLLVLDVGHRARVMLIR